MLRINTCELLHTNSYVVNQSYEFVFHLTSSLQPPNKKVRTFGKWCWWRSSKKAPSLMLQIKTCELPHMNSYVYNQSYKFVLRNTKNYFPPEPKKLTQHTIVWYSKYIVVCTTKTNFPQEPKTDTTAQLEKRFLQPTRSVGRFLQPMRSECIRSPFVCQSVCQSVCLCVRAKKGIE